MGKSLNFQPNIQQYLQDVESVYKIEKEKISIGLIPHHV